MTKAEVRTEADARTDPAEFRATMRSPESKFPFPFALAAREFSRVLVKQTNPNFRFVEGTESNSYLLSYH